MLYVCAEIVLREYDQLSLKLYQSKYSTMHAFECNRAHGAQCWLLLAIDPVRLVSCVRKLVATYIVCASRRITHGPSRGLYLERRRRGLVWVKYGVDRMDYYLGYTMTVLLSE